MGDASDRVLAARDQPGGPAEPPAHGTEVERSIGPAGTLASSGWSPSIGPQAATPGFHWTVGRGLIFLGLVAVIGAALISLGEAGRLIAAARGLLERPELLILFLATYTVAFYLRALAWGVLLPAGAPGTPVLWRLLQVALLANHVFPTKAGEAIRVALIARRGVSIGAAVGSTGLARLLDFAGLCLIAAAAGTLLGIGPDQLAVGLALPLAGVGGGVIGWLLIRGGCRPAGRCRLPMPAA
ncbi:MAG TPA: lysylphosphatidylglycerol synthase domain-containing protein, partial [Dehalococcoidia bacterium]|nr:lysylphosphatidylglycerol synthase domain-containing protein [Dehalococcoidia bacterium]